MSNYFERLAIRGAADVSVAGRARGAEIPAAESDLPVVAERASTEPADRATMELGPLPPPPAGTPAKPTPIAEPRLPVAVRPEGSSVIYEGAAEPPDGLEGASHFEQPAPPVTVTPIVTPRPMPEAAASRTEEAQTEPAEVPSTNVVTVISPRERVVRVPFDVTALDPAAPAAEAASPPSAPPLTDSPTVSPALPVLVEPVPFTPSAVASARVEPRASEPAVAVALAESAMAAPEEVSIEVHIGSLELNQPAPPAPAPQRPAPPAYPSGFAGYERARNYRDRDWY